MAQGCCFHSNKRVEFLKWEGLNSLRAAVNWEEAEIVSVPFTQYPLFLRNHKSWLDHTSVYFSSLTFIKFFIKTFFLENMIE